MSRGHRASNRISHTRNFPFEAPGEAGGSVEDGSGEGPGSEIQGTASVVAAVLPDRQGEEDADDETEADEDEDEESDEEFDIEAVIEELQERRFLDDYLSNVVFGYQIISETETYATRYIGNRLRCTHCHLQAGTKKDAIPLNVAGMYPKWRGKNGRRNGIGLRIRECFVYSLDGIMPPENAPEVLAIAAYISFLSTGQVMGQAPEGRGVPRLPDTGFDANHANGAIVYETRCSICHGPRGQGTDAAPPLWGMDSFNEGAGMNRIAKAAGFIWANMPIGDERSLSYQEAKDVAAFLHTRLRPSDPRKNKIAKFVEDLFALLPNLQADGEEGD